MGVQQFSQTVRGSGGTLRTNTSGVVETNNYNDVQALSGSAYPLSANPGWTIQEVVVLQNPGNGKTVDFTTLTGDSVTGLPLGSSLPTLDTIEMDSISINDPSANGGTTTVLLVGE